MATILNDVRTPSQPMNVEQIVGKASSFEYNPLIPLKYWIRTAGTLLKEAEIYEREGNDQQTYLLLYRHAQLVLKHLSTSPDAKLSHQNRSALAHAHKEVNRNLKKLEVLKPRINKRYERYEQLLRDRDARRALTVAAPQNSRATTPTGHKRVFLDPAIANDTETLAAGENEELAVNLAHKEIKRRATARKATRQAGIPEEVEHERRTAGLWGNWEEALVDNDDTVDRDILSRQMQAVQAQVNDPAQKGRRNERRPSFERPSSTFRYPSVPGHKTAASWQTPSVSDYPSSYEMHAAQQAPEPPPKDAETFLLDETPPERPEKELLLVSNGDGAHGPSTPPPVPPQQADPKPSEFTFKPSAYLENGTPLRTIFLPPDLRHRFLSIASRNTEANLETCGILCGTLISNALFISKLVIPDQESTSDTCEMINESDLFDYVDGEDLMVLGWIHTHPTQTCFMSSRDLHTHGGYQVMMPESIAIVCAPSKGEWGVFRLTDPPGMKSILNCTQSGLFHPHAESNVYTDALRPGHVYEATGLHFDLVDLRSR